MLKQVVWLGQNRGTAVFPGAQSVLVKLRNFKGGKKDKEPIQFPKKTLPEFVETL